MKKTVFLFAVIPTFKLGFVVITSIFCLFANTGHSQTVELFEEKVLINNMAVPWGFTFINSNEVLFTEKQGKLYRYNISSGVLGEITGVPAVSLNGQGGLLDVAIHPNFSNNNFVYLTYAVTATGGQTTALGRGTLVGNQLQNFQELFRALPIRNSGQHFGSRIVFDKNNLLYMSVGDRGAQNEAQNKNNHLGKVLRFNDDGTVPAGNPLVGVPNTKPEIYCWGNRNIQGMAMNPATGEIYAHEHGPRGGDELNLIKPNTNFGWPEVTFGINYDGSSITPDTTLPGMQLPITYWVPSIAPSGMTFISNGQANNEADILIGALAGTHIHWVKLKDNKRVASSRSMNGYARFRDIRQAPDGKVYAMTESPNRFVQLRLTGLNNTSTNDTKNEQIEKGMIYPNPSMGESTLTFYVSKNQFVSVNILSSNGTLINTLVAKPFSKGNYSLTLNSDKLPQGVYCVEINSGSSKTLLKYIKI
ncbi:MAG: PQQ-dependent sugar dehydrogenase [Sphingomonadales bacterium]|jgi:glucose/arabinose dehydrogenase